MAHVNPPRRIQTAMSRMPLGPATIAVPLGSVLFVAGCGLAAAWYFGVAKPNRGVPGWMLGWVGGLFALSGAFVTAKAGRHLLWKRRARSLAFAWQRDYPWPAREASDAGAPGMRQHAAGVLVAVAILVPLNFGLLLSFEKGLPPGGILELIPLLGLVLLDLLILLSLAYLVYRAVQRQRFGRSRLVFENGPPLLLGGELRARLEVSPLLAAAHECTATLRAVHEYMQVSGDDHTHVAEVLYEDSAPLEVSPTGSAQVRFALPANAPATSLAEPPTRYWELVVGGKCTGIDFEAVFLLPVYATAD